MIRQEFIRKLKKIGITQSSYSIDGNDDRCDISCLSKSEDGWQVYDLNHSGERLFIRTFPSEEEALEELFISLSMSGGRGI